MSQLPFQQNPNGQVYYQFPPNQQYVYVAQPYAQYPQNQPPVYYQNPPQGQYIINAPVIYSKTDPPQSPGVITSQSETTQAQCVIYPPGTDNFGNKTVLLQKSQFSRQTLEVVGQFHPQKMNPISQYQFFLNNYHEECNIVDGIRLKNIPSCKLLLWIYDLDIYLLECVVNFFLAIFFCILLICSKNSRFHYLGKGKYLYVQFILGFAFLVCLNAIPYLNIAYLGVHGFFTVYFCFFLLFYYVPNRFKVDILKNALHVDENCSLLKDCSNEFIKYTTEVHFKF